MSRWAAAQLGSWLATLALTTTGLGQARAVALPEGLLVGHDSAVVALRDGAPVSADAAAAAEVPATAVSPATADVPATAEPLVVSAPPVALKWKKKRLGTGGDSSALVVDAAGDPHVVFARETPEGRVLTHAWAEGAKWRSEPIATGAVAYDNALAIDAAGELHVAYALDGPSLQYARRTGGSWETEPLGAGGLSNSLVLDEAGRAHILHIDGISGALRYTRQSLSGWETETFWFNGSWFGGSSLLLRDGKVYATFSEGPLLCLATRDRGAWTVDEIADGTAATAAFDADGVLHVVYQAGTELRHTWKAREDWEEETLVSALEVYGEPVPPGFGAIGEYPALVAHPAGGLQLVHGVYLWKGAGWTEALFAARLEGGAWTPSLVSGKRVGFHPSVGVDARGLVHIASSAPLGSDGALSSVSAFRLKGARLSLAVTPAGSGTVSVAPTGTLCTSKSNEFVFPGSELTLTAVPAAGFVFVGWKGSLQGSEPELAVSMDAQRKLVARFARAP